MHTTYKKYLIILAVLAAFASACTDELSNSLYSNASGRLAARRIEKAEVTSRADNNTYFDEGTAYRLWAYANKEVAGRDTADFDNSVFEKIDAIETSLHYVDVGANSNRIKNNIHIYGFTDATEHSVDIASDESFHISPVNEKYTDYLAGYIHYDPEAPEYQDASYAVIPFGHIMAQVNVKLLQFGKVSYHYEEGGEVVYDLEDSTYTDLKIKEISLRNTYKEANYCLRSNEFKDRSAKDSLKLWSTDEPLHIPVEIPENQDNGKPVTTNLVLPQSPTVEDGKMQLKLKICGTDAEEFLNASNAGSYRDHDGSIVILIDLDDNSTDKNALNFKSNYSYTLIVSFQSDQVRIVTLAPLIYPFFQGEYDPDKPDQDYQDQAFEQPSVFDNIQWCDRYTGADLGFPSTIEQFQESTGFYYQKNRTIPFYPTDYVNYSILDNNYWQVEDESDMVKGAKWYDGSRGWMWRGGKIYYKYGGQWKDVKPEEMFFLPEVKPVVSFWMPDEVQVTGYDYNMKTNWGISLQDSYFDGYGRESVFWNSNLKDETKPKTDEYGNPVKDSYGNFIYEVPLLDEDGHYIYGKEGTNRYCSTVLDFAEGDTIKTYLTWYAGVWQPVNKRLNWAMQINKDTIPKFRTWDDNTTNLPCPPGWRLPTKQDFLTVFPASAAAGNITFLDFLSFGNDISTIAPIDNNTAWILLQDDGKELLDVYVKTPFNVSTEAYTNFFPPLAKNGIFGTGGSGGYRQLDDDMEKRQLLSHIEMGDPAKGYVSEYVISKREFTATEYANYNIVDSGISQSVYESFAPKVAGLIARPVGNLKTYEPRYIGNDPKWGVIYAIKKLGTDEAYRLRYSIKKIPTKSYTLNGTTKTLEAYVLVVEQYKATKSDHLKFRLKDINDNQFFLRYSWDYPDATLYFPITGMVADAPCINGQTDKDNWVCSVFNYGTETILLSNEYENDEQNQAVLRIKIGGTNAQNQFIFQGMARMGLGGQVRAVRTFRSGGD